MASSQMQWWVQTGGVTIFALVATNTLACIHAHTHAHTHAQTHLHAYTHAHTHAHTHMHMHTHSHVHAHAHTCMHTYYTGVPGSVAGPGQDDPSACTGGVTSSNPRVSWPSLTGNSSKPARLCHDGPRQRRPTTSAGSAAEHGAVPHVSRGEAKRHPAAVPREEAGDGGEWRKTEQGRATTTAAAAAAITAKFICYCDRPAQVDSAKSDGKEARQGHACGLPHVACVTVGCRVQAAPAKRKGRGVLWHREGWDAAGQRCHCRCHHHNLWCVVDGGKVGSKVTRVLREGVVRIWFCVFVCVHLCSKPTRAFPAVVSLVLCPLTPSGVVTAESMRLRAAVGRKTTAPAPTAASESHTPHDPSSGGGGGGGGAQQQASLFQFVFWRVVLDEAHMIKNRSTVGRSRQEQRTKRRNEACVVLACVCVCVCVCL